MAAELGLLSLSQFQKSSQSQALHDSPSKSPWMWNNNKRQLPHEDNEDDSWEVRAFEEDTAGNLLGCTWPPRSYTCTFCRREFRSAQALGGHMNVHRRDRARLHEAPPLVPPSSFASADKSSTSTPPATVLIPTEDLIAKGLCLLYSLPNNPNGVLLPTASINGNVDSPSPLLSVLSSLTTTNKSIDFPLMTAAISSFSHSSNIEPSSSYSNDNNQYNNETSLNIRLDSSAIEELDLELRLGRKSPSPPPEGR